ncbi:MAG: division/cell wall cluster transcriptional repressor MraZ, partial [bacterium]
MFRGIFHNALDAKGRLNIPARLREQIKSDHETPLVLTLGFDQCLFLYPMDAWKKIEDQLSSLN